MVGEAVGTGVAVQTEAEALAAAWAAVAVGVEGKAALQVVGLAVVQEDLGWVVVVARAQLAAKEVVEEGGGIHSSGTTGRRDMHTYGSGCPLQSPCTSWHSRLQTHHSCPRDRILFWC